MMCVCVHIIIGGDGTELFEDIGHTSHARALMNQFCIGEVAAQTERNDS